MGVSDAYLSAAAYDLLSSKLHSFCFLLLGKNTANDNWEKLIYGKLHFGFFLLLLLKISFHHRLSNSNPTLSNGDSPFLYFGDPKNYSLFKDYIWRMSLFIHSNHNTPFLYPFFNYTFIPFQNTLSLHKHSYNVIIYCWVYRILVSFWRYRQYLFRDTNFVLLHLYVLTTAH